MTTDSFTPRPLTSIAEALCRYDSHLRQLPITEAEFEACIQSLPPALQAACRRLGRDDCLTSWTFREYCLDCGGSSRAEFLRAQLTADSFANWQANLDFWNTWYECCAATNSFPV